MGKIARRRAVTNSRSEGVGALSLTTLRCASWLSEIDDLGYVGVAAEVSLGPTTIPIVKATGCRYIPQLRMVVGPDGVVPLESIQRQWDFDHHWGRRTETIAIERQMEVHDPVCVLSTPWSFVFGHWLTEELVKVFLIEQAGLDVRYVVHVDAHSEHHQLQQFMLDSLRALGVGSDRLILGFPDADAVVFDSMVFPPTIHEGQALRFPDVYEAFREAQVAASTHVADAGPRVWLRRNHGVLAGRLGQTNEQEVEDLVRQYDFQCVDMGERGFLDQIAAARGATILAGIHGSAFVHVLFQPARSAVVECFPPDHVNPSVLTFCQLRQHRYHMIVPASAYDHERGSPWSLDLKHLTLVLDDLTRSDPPR